MVKIYVVDTNVLIQAPYALTCFEDNQVVIPMVVLVTKGIPVEVVYQTDEEGKPRCPKLWENEFVIVTSDQSLKKTQLGRVENGYIKKLEYRRSMPYGVTPRNVGQYFLLGDPNQIDRPFLDERTNGLSYAAEHMKGSPLCWQLTLSAEECERSALAAEAVQRL